jgi:hypothetical protein
MVVGLMFDIVVVSGRNLRRSRHELFAKSEMKPIE